MATIEASPGEHSPYPPPPSTPRAIQRHAAATAAGGAVMVRRWEAMLFLHESQHLDNADVDRGRPFGTAQLAAESRRQCTTGRQDLNRLVPGGDTLPNVRQHFRGIGFDLDCHPLRAPRRDQVDRLARTDGLFNRDLVTRRLQPRGDAKLPVFMFRVAEYGHDVLPHGRLSHDVVSCERTPEVVPSCLTSWIMNVVPQSRRPDDTAKEGCAKLDSTKDFCSCG